MRFTIRTGTDAVARADATILAAMGLPGGGAVRIGRTHLIVRPGEVASPTTLALNPRALANSGLTAGATADVKRANLPQARRVVLDGDAGLEPRHLARALQGHAVTTGDRVDIAPGYGGHDGPEEPAALTVAGVEPGGAGLVGNATVVAGPDPDGTGEREAALVGHPAGRITGEAPTTAQALLAGLDEELDTLTGWLRLLTSPEDLPTAWGLPRVAGVLLEGPAGCGKSELVSAAAARAGTAVQEISLELVFKPERLIDLLEKAVKTTATPAVLFVDRLDAVAGDEGMFRTQVAAILRWFLDAVSERAGLACVLGISSVAGLDDSLSGSQLLPKALAIPPPDLERRRLLFEAALGRVPTDEIDFAALAAGTAGYSGADIISAVVNASATVARSGDPLDTADLLESVAATTPSLGSVPTGEMPTYGFDRVANLDEVKQRLTEAVIWPITDPARFHRMGIDPPRGLLLYGPPGTGKTFVVRALAHESGAAFFAVKGAELLDKFVGESERAVREVFARARSVAPSILFFDELDALAPVRGRSTTSVTDSVVAALLTEMDGVGERGDVVVIGATNRKDLIDPALLRSGRFETHLELGLPEQSARRALLGISDVPFADDVDLDDLAARTAGLSFADLTGLLREAALGTLRRDPTAITVGNQDLTAALERIPRS
ncbi:MAG: ATP-binding protein [Actinobacteria bacterium]|nr:ATP-binding protein [Actinomycetota bacterium]